MRIEPARTPTLSFPLTPRGALTGHVGADVGAFDHPAGSYRPPHATVRINSIELAGETMDPAVRRTLVPHAAASADLALARYLDDEDDAYGAYFSFLDLPDGTYRLTIRAEGYRPHTSTHAVVAGRPGQIAPIGLTPR